MFSKSFNPIMLRRTISFAQQHSVNRQSSPIPLLHVAQQTFHTSPRRHIHPLLLVVLKPVAKLTAALSGRFVRKWYQRLGPAERKNLWAKVRRHWYVPAGGCVTLVGVTAGYYVTHLEETPITGRRRFVALTHNQILKIINAEAEQLMETFKGKCFPDDSPESQRVFKVMGRLAKANPELRENLPFQHWTVFVVNDPSVNACVLPNGYVFVFDGMLKVAESQDELAAVLGHEMAHGVLGHGMEELSLTTFMDYIVILTLGAIWCVLPGDGLAIVAHWFYNRVIKLSTHLPHSRMIEREADKVGLQFAAKACFDTRGGSVLWKKMAIQEKVEEHEGAKTVLPEWMSTHPDSAKRAEHLDFLLPTAIDMRDSMKCPQLPSEDPRDCVNHLAAKVNEVIAAKKAGQNLRQVQVHKVPRLSPRKETL